MYPRLEAVKADSAVKGRKEEDSRFEASAGEETKEKDQTHKLCVRYQVQGQFSLKLWLNLMEQSKEEQAVLLTHIRRTNKPSSAIDSYLYTTCAQLRENP